MKDCAVKEKRSLIYNIESDVFKTFIIIVHISQKVSTNFHDNFQNIPRGLLLAPIETLLWTCTCSPHSIWHWDNWAIGTIWRVAFVGAFTRRILCSAKLRWLLYINNTLSSETQRFTIFTVCKKFLRFAGRFNEPAQRLEIMKLQSSMLTISAWSRYQFSSVSIKING